MTSPVNAPDGLRWPLPIVAVDKSEARPFTFGWHPYADRMTDRSIVASSEVNHASPIVQKYGHPFHLVSAELPTADYWLVGPQGPVAGFVGIERKERDLASSLTAEMPRFKEECDRLRDFTNPIIITSCSLEALLSPDVSCLICPSEPCSAANPLHALFCNQCGGQMVGAEPYRHEAAFIGGLSCIMARHRIPIVAMPSRALAGRFAARMLVEWWQAWLAVNPDVLAWAREEERRRGITREHARKQRARKAG